MKKFFDQRQETLGCPYCHCKVYPYNGPRPMSTALKPLLVISRQRLYEDGPPKATRRRRNSITETYEQFEQTYDLNQTFSNSTSTSIASKLLKARRDHHSEPHSPIFADISQMHIYPLMLTEIAILLDQHKIPFVLYGSGALWLTGDARPSDKVTIKDLDMCVECPPDQQKTIEGKITQIMKGSASCKAMDFSDEQHVYVTENKTMEFTSPHDNVQFSFNLQTPQMFQETLDLSVKIDVLGTGVEANITSLRFIQKRLFGDDALIATRLFRCDKTDQVLLYCAMVCGCRELEKGAQEIVDEILKYSVKSDKLKQLLGSITRDHKGQKSNFDDRIQIIKSDYDRRMRMAKAIANSLKGERTIAVMKVEESLRGSEGQKWELQNKSRLDKVRLVSRCKMEVVESKLKYDTITFIIERLKVVNDDLFRCSWLSMHQMNEYKKGIFQLIELLNNFNLSLKTFSKLRFETKTK